MPETEDHVHYRHPCLLRDQLWCLAAAATTTTVADTALNSRIFRLLISSTFPSSAPLLPASLHLSCQPSFLGKWILSLLALGNER